VVACFCPLQMGNVREMKFDPIAIRREFVEGMTKLNLWYAWRLQRREGLDFETVFAKRVRIYQMTVFAGDSRNGKSEDTDGWQRVLGELRELYERHRSEATSEEIEAEGLALLWPYLEPAIERDVALNAQWFQESFGCFKYEYRPFYAEPDSDDHLTLHVYNAHQPDSPFRHFPELVESLQEIVALARGERPDVEWAQCASWLNSLPAFARLFPQSWTDTAVPGDPGAHFGWWGQFMDRRGGFHVKNARRFRETGQFPFMHRLCRCELVEFKPHLEQLAALEQT